MGGEEVGVVVSCWEVDEGQVEDCVFGAGRVVFVRVHVDGA